MPAPSCRGRRGGARADRAVPHELHRREPSESCAARRARAPPRHRCAERSAAAPCAPADDSLHRSRRRAARSAGSSRPPPASATRRCDPPRDPTKPGLVDGDAHGPPSVHLPYRRVRQGSTTRNAFTDSSTVGGARPPHRPHHPRRGTARVVVHLEARAATVVRVHDRAARRLLPYGEYSEVLPSAVATSFSTSSRAMPSRRAMPWKAEGGASERYGHGRLRSRHDSRCGLAAVAAQRQQPCERERAEAHATRITRQCMSARSRATFPRISTASLPT